MTQPLTHAYVLRVAGQEALTAGCPVEDVLHMVRTNEARDARARAWAKIIADTGCTGTQLAEAWGCDRASIWRAFPKRTWAVEPKPRQRGVYDPATHARLIAHYGQDRAEQIITGKCPHANADLASWRRLCGLGRAER